jgi:hypothetical protein
MGDKAVFLPVLMLQNQNDTERLGGKGTPKFSADRDKETALVQRIDCPRQALNQKSAEPFLQTIIKRVAVLRISF